MESMARAFSVHQILSSKFKLIEWGEKWVAAFSKPEASGVWFLWGNSGNAKTTFLMELAKELSKRYKVFYNSLEEGSRHTMQLTLLQVGIDRTNKNFIIGQEPMDELSERLCKRKAPQVVIIDSIQYTSIRFEAFVELKKKHPDVLFIISSHADGKEPDGRVAKKIKYDADLKIRVEGYKAISNGRYNPGGEYIIWPEGAIKYHGTQNTISHEQN